MPPNANLESWKLPPILTLYRQSLLCLMEHTGYLGESIAVITQCPHIYEVPIWSQLGNCSITSLHFSAEICGQRQHSNPEPSLSTAHLLASLFHQHSSRHSSSIALVNSSMTAHGVKQAGVAQEFLLYIEV